MQMTRNETSKVEISCVYDKFPPVPLSLITYTGITLHSCTGDCLCAVNVCIGGECVVKMTKFQLVMLRKLDFISSLLNEQFG